MKSKTSNSIENKNGGISLIKNLTDSITGEELIVIKVNAGFNAKRRLANLGIIPGVKIIKKNTAPFRGPIEIIVKGSSLVIGRGLAARIFVKCVGSNTF